MANRILITGANGQLGNEMRIIAKSSDDSYIFTDVVQMDDHATRYLDITDISALRRMVADEEINIIINCAAYTNVDKAESDTARATLLNSTAPGTLATVAREVDALLVHISTDYVFDGQGNQPYIEDDRTAPTSIYGSTKLAGEKGVINSGCRHIIIRTAWLYSEFGRNFCKTMIDLTSSKPQIRVVDDQIGTPTYARDLARTIETIVKHYDGSQDGIYHYSNEGICSWYDFARAIAELYGTTECEILPCTSDEFASVVKRPAYSVLDKSKIRRTFGVDVPHWRESLEECITNIKSR
ncbi:MAG: dTDP-4-dehydrorhamnose reductase [Alistipes sp.]|nr:dTDP-4-dehydrorhamnose reductase [Alistipes sp.]